MESSGSSNTHNELERNLKAELRSALGIGCNVKILGVGEIARSEGKAVRVIDNRHI